MTLTTLRLTCRVYPWKSITVSLQDATPVTGLQYRPGPGGLQSYTEHTSDFLESSPCHYCCRLLPCQTGMTTVTPDTALRPRCRLRRWGRTNAETLGHLLLLPSSLLVQAAQGSVGYPSLSST